MHALTLWLGLKLNPLLILIVCLSGNLVFINFDALVDVGRASVFNDRILMKAYVVVLQKFL